MTLTFLALCILFLSNALFIILFLKLREEKKIVDNKLNIAISDLSETRRIGFYSEVSTLCTTVGSSGEKYNCIIHVKEIDRYLNGTSRIQLEKVEVISGFDIRSYSYVKEIQEKQFSSIRKTADIEWLESESHIKEMRKLKLEKIKNV